MHKKVFGRRFKRDTNQRKALFRSLMRALILHGRIKTTEAKAKAVRGEIEKLVTKAKNKGNGTRYHLLKTLSPEIVDKMISDIAPRFVTRPGGYTRIIKVGERLKDAAPMVFLEWAEPIEVSAKGGLPPGQKNEKDEKKETKSPKDKITKKKNSTKTK